MTANIESLVEDLFRIDVAAEIDRISQWIRDALRQRLRKRGLIIGISGGVDSAVCAALAVNAVGADRVFGLLMPEHDSSRGSISKGQLVAEQLGIAYEVVDISPTLEAIGCYRWRDEAMKAAIPEFQPGWKNKIVISGGADGRLNHFKLVVEKDDGTLLTTRLGLKEYLQIVAATNYKQRVRKTLEFFHADRLNYAVTGTPNRLEYDQGFFVKNGDGSADLKPIAHLYKSQVYMLARHMALPETVRNAPPSTDTYSLSQGQDEFYFSLPYREMDVALLHYNQKRPAADLADALKIDNSQAEALYRDIASKRSTTAPLHWPPLLSQRVEGPQTSPT